jgi:hypothetical protein
LGIPGNLKNRGVVWGELEMDSARYGVTRGARMKADVALPRAKIVSAGLAQRHDVRGADDDRVFDVPKPRGS